MKSILVLIFIAVISAGCRSRQILTVPVETRTTVVERLVEVQTAADSAWLQAFLECDENNRVLLRGIDERKTARMGTELQVSDNKLTYRAVRASEKIYLPARDSIVIRDAPCIVEACEHTDSPVLTGWHWFQIWAGRLFLVLITTYIVLRIKKL